MIHLRHLLKRAEEILIARVLRALGLERAAQMQGEVVQMFKSEPEDPMLVGFLMFLISLLGRTSNQLL